MKTTKILYMLGVAAASLGLAACADTDAQYTIPNVDAPAFVKTTPETGASRVRRGDITVTVDYDKRVFFATKDMDQIKVSGATLVSADVYGTDSTLTMVVNCPQREQQVTISVPEGIVTGSQGKPAPEVNLSFTTIALDKTPVAASGKAAQLYNFLLNNFETKALSGIMADVAWNTDEAEKVNGWIGKYPAINCFDYLHMPASVAGLNWAPDYNDISVVQNWASQGGIVAAMWHWNVPKAEPTEGLSALDPANDYTFYAEQTTFNAANALTEGTWENEVFERDLAQMTAYLTLLKNADIPVLWRPFHEAAGGWFWWGKDAASFKALWIHMFDTFKQAGLDNLIWVWTTEGNDASWYPGDQYVDIVGRDLYTKETEDCVTEYNAASSEYGNKIVALSECGTVGKISEQWAAGAAWSWFMPWYEGESQDEDGNTVPVVHADQEWWQDAAAQGNVLFRGDFSF